MIPTILVVAVPLGIIFGMSNNKRVLVVGSVVTFLGWWVLVLVVGGVEMTPGVVLLASSLALVNLAIGVAMGWVGLRLVRRLFGMTPER
jgi:hypothetical protein